MQIMKWMITLFAATALCAGSALAADPAAPVGGGAGKEEQTGHASHFSRAHDMKGCMEMDGKKCMKMGDKDCMKGDVKQCDHHKGKKNRHKSHDGCDNMKGATNSDENKPAENKSDGKDDAAKPAVKQGD